MATVQQRVEHYIGLSLAAYSDELAQVLDDSVKEVIGLLPLDSLTTLWEELTDSGSGVDTSNKFIVEVRKNLYRAQQISPSMRTTDAASTTQPLYYSWQGNTYVIPSGGTVLVVTPPSIDPSDTTVANVPDSLMQLFVLRTAFNMLAVLAAKDRDTVVTALSMPSAPSAPTAPAIAYTSASGSDPSTVSIAALPTAPVYNSPSLASKPTEPTVGTLDLGTKVDGVTTLSPPTAPASPSIAYSDATAATISDTTVAALPDIPTFTTTNFGGSLSLPVLPTLDLETELDGSTPKSIPTAPVAPLFVYTGATAASVSATTLASLGTAPAYTKPVFSGSLSLPSLPTLDLETKIDGSTLKSIPSAPAAPSFTYVNATSAATAATTLASLGSAPTYVKSSDPLDLTEYTSYETNEDPEMMQSIIARLNTELSERQTDIQNETADFQRQLAEYQQDAQHKIEQARITLQEALADARSSTDVDVQNQLRSFEAEVQEYQSELARYQTQLTEYTTDTQAQLEEYQATFQNAFTAWREQQALYLQQYAQDIQNAANDFQKELVAYQQDAAHKIEQARITAQESLSDAQSSTDVSVQNQLRDFEAQVQEYQSVLARYQTQLSAYTTDTQAQLEEYQAAFQNAFTTWREQQLLYMQQYQSDITKNSTVFQGAMEDHQLEVQRILEQARIDADKLARQAQLDTDTSVQNEARTAEIALRNYAESLSRFSLETQLYQAEIEAVVQEYIQDLDRSIRLYEANLGGDVQRYQAETQDAQAAFQQSLSVYQATLERNNLQAQIARQEQQQIAAQATDVDVANKARDLEAQIADYQAELGRYSNQIQAYAQQVASVIQEQTGENQAIRAKIGMIDNDRERLSRQYEVAVRSYRKQYTHRRPMTAWAHDY